MPTIKYSDNPNEETAFVTQDGGQRNRAVLTAAVDGTIEYPNNPNSTKVIVTVDGVKRRAVAVADIAGGGGGDQHNLGWYATESALTTAHPTASDGDYAIVGDTDTVWVWDGDTTAWVDSGAGGIGLPDQTGHSGEFLFTDGTDASWAKAAANWAKGTESFVVGYSSSYCYDRAGTLRNTVVNGYSNYSRDSVAVGHGAGASSTGSTCVGRNAQSAANYSISIGFQVSTNAQYAIQLGYDSTNNDANTFKVGNANGNFEIMSADGTIPEARLADTTNAQQGDVLTLDSTGNAVWQAGGSGGGLPSQTGNAGKFLTTDGTNASWANALQNTATSTDTIAVVRDNANINSRWSVIFNTNRAHSSNSAGSIVMGYYAQSTNGYALAFGFSADVSGYQGMAFGYNASVSGSHSIQFGNGENSENNTLKVSFGNSSSDPNYTLLSGDGTIPSARLIKVNTTVTLAAADWSSNTQTVNVTGMTADGIVMVGPAPTDHSEYTSAGIYCTAQASGALTFTCDSEPAGDIDVNVVML